MIFSFHSYLLCGFLRSPAHADWLRRVCSVKASPHPTPSQLYSGASQQPLRFTPVLSKTILFLSPGNDVNHLSASGTRSPRASVFITCKRNIFPVNHHILFSPRPQGSERYFVCPATWCSAYTLTCVDSAAEKAHGVEIVKMLMGWLCNRHCLWAAGASSVLVFKTQEETVQFRPQRDPQRTRTRRERLNYTGSFSCFGWWKSVRGGRILLLVTASGNWTWTRSTLSSPQFNIWRFMSMNSPIMVLPLTRGYN